ncbi:polysaccharide biosynthesis/export family protein [Asticcacaulis sp. AC402]|uniref:polysaccharide biosynthesis/export family protein n=1 Tax=Asticcacaulis sp. AC402 TaxID=1282361 RepID=UPI0004173A48|nr:polysaccharide biosynthesis/export family protein [Asticcacaulis sp. AC402]
MITRRTLLAGATLAGLAPAAVVRAGERMPRAHDIPFATWTDDEPLYLFYPGDKLEIVVPSAPELNRQTQIGPDGRITLALIGQVMAAYRSVPDLQQAIAARYAQILRDPTIFVYPGDIVPMRVLVGGEVNNPGWVEMMADMDALQATLAAGGFTRGAKRDKVMLIRRGPSGGAMRRVIDLKTPLQGKAGDLVALRRFDILFVPRTGIAEAGVFMEQWVNNLIPGGVLNYFMYQTFSN